MEQFLLNQKLILASRLGDEEHVKNCLNSGAQVGFKGCGALYQAIENNHANIIHLLSSWGLPLDQAPFPLLIAIERGKIESVRALLDLKVDPNFKNGLPLITSINFEQYEIARILLTYGADVTIQNHKPMAYAAAAGHVDLVHLFLKFNGDRTVAKKIALAYQQKNILHYLEKNIPHTEMTLVQEE